MAQFFKDVRQFGVTCCSVPTILIGLFGFLSWVCPLTIYSVLLYRSKNVWFNQVIWMIDITLHALTGVLTDIDAFFYNGRVWPLRAFIMGGNSFITLTLPGIFGYYRSVNDDASAILVLVAMACNCLFNASLIAITVETFQKRTSL